MKIWGKSAGPGDAALPPLEAVRDFDGEVRLGDAARDRRDWAAAAVHYRLALDYDASRAGIWVQLGHAQKESGDLGGAELAYRRATTIEPGAADTHVQLGHALKLAGRRTDAVAAYAEAARIDPTLDVATRELIDMGARDAMPEIATRSTELWRRTTAIAELLAGGLGALRDGIGGTAYPLAAYDRFRREVAVRPPPGVLPASDDLLILIYSTVAAPFLLRDTLRSLQDQSVPGWRAIVIAPAALHDHPVGGFAVTDARVVFALPDAAVPEAAHTISIDAGTVLDREALAWLLFAAQRTGAPAVFADHDHGIVDPALRLVRADPFLWGAYDPLVAAALEPPAIVLATGAIPPGCPDGATLRRTIVAQTAAQGGVPHVARVLATRLDLPLIARAGRDSADDAIPGRLGAAPATVAAPRPPVPANGRIAIVIPTRDAGALLRVTIDSLRATARDPSRLDFVVVDNRTTDDLTLRLFADLTARGLARIVPFDAPFNWSLASNLGAAESDAPTILFANNDIEMRTIGWDDAAIAALEDDRVGAIGARLLYPDGRVQHAGMVCGFGPGGVEHEGRDRSSDDPGPMRRLLTTRTVAAVTGAFLGVRRADFDAIEGFDAGQLMIGHSDVDLCLRLRERGLLIRYCAEIEATHHEGATRGRNETRAAIAWDESERADLIARWGEALSIDAGVSPYWVPGGVPFDGLRDPPPSVILRHIDRTARPDPWRPARRDAHEAARWSPAALA